MKHTKKPWSICVSENFTSIEAPAQTICLDVSNCDADLIAAAPDMYEALKGIVADLENIVAPYILEATKEALLKAEG